MHLLTWRRFWQRRACGVVVPGRQSLLYHAEETLPERDDAVPPAGQGVCCVVQLVDAEVEVPFEDDVAEPLVPWAVTSKAVLVLKAESKAERSIFSAFVVPALEES